MAPSRAALGHVIAAVPRRRPGIASAAAGQPLDGWHDRLPGGDVVTGDGFAEGRTHRAWAALERVDVGEVDDEQASQVMRIEGTTSNRARGQGW